MNFKALFPSSLILKSIFVVAVFLLIFISSITYKHTVALDDSSQLVMHSYKVQVELEQLFSYLKDAETGQRGFIITQDTVFLKPYVDANEKITKSFITLKLLTKDNALQQNNLDTLYHLINERFRILAHTLALNAATPFSRERLNYGVLQGKNMMDNIRKKVNAMIDLEEIYLKERQKKYEENISFTPLFTLFLLLFSLCVFVFSYIQINKDLYIFKKANQALTIITESIKHAEEIGDFSTWQWNLETNTLSYSDNQYRLLGCEPQSFEPTVEKFLQFVHPDDRHIIIEGKQFVMNDGNYPFAFFRIIRADGEVRYFKSLSKELTDAKGKKMLIGVNSDVTEQHLNSLILEEKNQNLEQRNQELASFNHIASHDLQEPLRKIQTFISRISEKELAHLSPTSQDYFVKIQSSAQKMRLLIDDLLLFSRANKIEKAFELTDLTILLDNAQQELAEVIIEKNAVIQSDPLPELTVIPFQIQQLFTNLVANSLKYSKSNSSPLIVINCETITAKDEALLKINTDNKYCKISIADNGIGFEQQHAEKIFNLFKRLHTTNVYSGTGIGLAICKKIVENHTGFIVAEGIPDRGATFTIFLPV